ncbi:MAG: hypothetical protein PVH61_27390 [Candidatus Aminicenantes bacterium]
MKKKYQRGKSKKKVTKELQQHDKNVSFWRNFVSACESLFVI